MILIIEITSTINQLHNLLDKNDMKWYIIAINKITEKLSSFVRTLRNNSALRCETLNEKHYYKYSNEMITIFFFCSELSKNSFIEIFSRLEFVEPIPPLRRQGKTQCVLLYNRANPTEASRDARQKRIAAR